MDALSSILVSLKVEATAIANFLLRMPWALDASPFETTFCFCIVEGACWFKPAGEEGRWLYPGDSVLMPRGGYFSLSGAPELTPVSMEEVWLANGLPLFDGGTFAAPMTFRSGGTGALTRMLGLAFAFTGVAHRALLESLPTALYVDALHSTGFPWLRSGMDFLTAEGGEAKLGYVALAHDLAELIFISLVRAHVLNGTQQPRGWLRGLSDKRIAKALSAMHDAPGTAWSLIALAAQAGMSRAAFAARFHELIGQTPMSYLTAWRMHLAAEKLAQEKIKIAQLTDELGYSSERAFRSAFKQHMGTTPQAYRKRISAI